MKKCLFLILVIAAFNVEASHYQSSMSVTPMSENQYLVELQVEKVIDAHSSPKLFWSPKIICVPGERAQVICASDDETDLLSLQVLIPNSSSPQKSIQSSILVKEKGQVVLSLNNGVQLSSHL